MKEETGGEKKTTRDLPVKGLLNFPPSPHFPSPPSYPCCVPLLVLALLFSPYSFFPPCVLSLSAAGPHPHRQYECFPVLSSPVHCNSATLSTRLLMDAVKTPLCREWNEPGRAWGALLFCGLVCTISAPVR